MEVEYEPQIGCLTTDLYNTLLKYAHVHEALRCPSIIKGCIKGKIIAVGACLHCIKQQVGQSTFVAEPSDNYLHNRMESKLDGDQDSYSDNYNIHSCLPNRVREEKLVCSDLQISVFCCGFPVSGQNAGFSCPKLQKGKNGSLNPSHSHMETAFCFKNV